MTDGITEAFRDWTTGTTAAQATAPVGNLSEGATVAVGFVCVVLGGVMSGTYSLPMRFVRTWAWENLWLVYCSLGGFLFPLVFCAATAPRGLEAYLTARAVLPVVAFGVLWGFASVLFGLAIPLVGQSLTFGIVLSMSSAVGSLLPMLIFHTDKSFAPSGLFVWAGLVVAVAGVAALSVAGVRKEREQSVAAGAKGGAKDTTKGDNGTGGDATQEPTTDGARSTTVLAATCEGPTDTYEDEELTAEIHQVTGAVHHDDSDDDGNNKNKEGNNGDRMCGLSKAALGIVYCIVSGLLSPMLNLGFTFGDSIRAGAETLGASPLVSSSTVWVLAIGAGFTFNGGYPIYLLCRNRTWRRYRGLPARDTGVNALLMLAMAVLWYGGTVVYGIGATLIGALGATIGWPVYMALMVLSANIGAVIQGEWRGTTARPRALLAFGLAVLLVSIVFFALSSVFDTANLLSSSLSSSSS